MKFTINACVKTLVPKFKVGVISYSNINVQHSATEIQKEINEICTNLKSYSNVTDIQGISEGRRLFKTLGIDPSKYRPSSEALIRRAFKGDGVPTIHSAADINNLFSLKYAIPIGIYDYNKLTFPIEIRLGRDNDEYEGISNRITNMKGKLLCADDTGPFGSPIVDSKRTMVTQSTKNALQVLFFYPDLTDEQKAKIINDVSQVFQFFHGGTVSTFLID